MVSLADVPPDIGAFYPADYYTQAPENQGMIRGADIYRLGLLSRYVAPGPLVDVGAGWGSFAEQAGAAGYAVTAIEMSKQACHHLAGLAGVAAVESDDPASALAGLPPSAAVSMWHVIEHLPDPWRVLSAAAANLLPGGVLAVATPNPDSLQFRLLRRRWAHLDAPRHLFLIPSATLTRKAQTLGLERMLLTTSDPAGRQCDRLGWVHAFMADPGHPAARRLTTRASHALALPLGDLCDRVLAPIQRQRNTGSAYTALFRKTSE